MGHAESDWLALIGEAAKSDFIAIAKIAGYELDDRCLKVEPGPAPHKRRALPPSNMAVYSFWRGKEALKVGLASPNNDARFRFHHYSPGTSNSNLARSISVRFGELGLVAPPTDYRAWIELETGRIDFLMPASWGQPVARLLEGYLHARWRPRFEGRVWSGNSDTLPAPHFDVSVQNAAS